MIVIAGCLGRAPYRLAAPASGEHRYGVAGF